MLEHVSSRPPIAIINFSLKGAAHFEIYRVHFFIPRGWPDGSDYETIRRITLVCRDYLWESAR